MALSSAGCGCLSLPDPLATPQGTDVDSLRAEASKAKLEVEQLTATVVKQRELIQANTNDSSMHGAACSSFHSRSQCISG